MLGLALLALLAAMHSAEAQRRRLPSRTEPIPDTETGAKAGINGGILKPPRPEPWPGNMTMYVDVDDLDKYRKRVVEAGGKILIEEQAVPGMGKLSLFLDTEGRMMGLWKHGG